MELVSTAINQQHRIARDLFSTKGVDDFKDFCTTLFPAFFTIFDLFNKIGVYSVYRDEIRFSQQKLLTFLCRYLAHCCENISILGRFHLHRLL